MFLGEKEKGGKWSKGLSPTSRPVPEIDAILETGVYCVKVHRLLL